MRKITYQALRYSADPFDLACSEEGCEARVVAMAGRMRGACHRWLASFTMEWVNRGNRH